MFVPLNESDGLLEIFHAGLKVIHSGQTQMLDA
jgi:hypothetical protein